MKQKGVTLWLTGLSGSGKSIIGVELSTHWLENRHQAYILDGDAIRHGLRNKNLGFSPDDGLKIFAASVRLQVVYRCET